MVSLGGELGVGTRVGRLRLAVGRGGRGRGKIGFAGHTCEHGGTFERGKTVKRSTT